MVAEISSRSTLGIQAYTSADYSVNQGFAHV